MTKNNIACAYIRVSTDDQTEYSPDAQLNAIKKYVKDNNLILPSEYIFIDEGYSGRKAEKRPAFMKMITTAKKTPTPFSIILVHKFDRFARNREDSVVYKSLLRKDCNIKVISITESIEDDKFSIILESMLEAMAEYYSLNLAEEVKKGMSEKAKLGEYQAYAPLGYDNDKINKTLIINKSEAETIKYIFNEFINNIPIHQITKNLNNIGIKSKKGNPFERRTVEYILRNTVYIGYTTWCETEKRKNDYNKSAHIVKGNYPAIIDEDMFKKVQKKIKEYKNKYPYKQKPTEFKHYLSGIIKCSSCGSSLSIGNKYTQCISYSHGKCLTSNYLSIEKLEKVILSQLDNIIMNNFDKLKINVKNNPTHNSQYTLLKNELSKLNLRLNRAKLAYLNEIDTLEDYKNTKNSLEINITELKEKLSLENTSNPFNKNSLKDKNLNLKEILLDKNIPQYKKSNIIRSFIRKIVYKKDTKTLEFYFYM